MMHLAMNNKIAIVSLLGRTSWAFQTVEACPDNKILEIEAAAIITTIEEEEVEGITEEVAAVVAT